MCQWEGCSQETFDLQDHVERVHKMAIPWQTLFPEYFEQRRSENQKAQQKESSYKRPSKFCEACNKPVGRLDKHSKSDYHKKNQALLDKDRKEKVVNNRFMPIPLPKNLLVPS